MEKLLRQGIGYDVHALVEDRKLILGGVEIPFAKGLLGHSDADVLVHALMDAMLGALALGDIGQHFPDTDPAYQDISSLELLRRVRILVEEAGGRLVNADLIVLAQAPKLFPYIPAMREKIAACLDLAVERISIKATTTEHLGFVGREEGMAALAVVSMEEELGKR